MNASKGKQDLISAIAFGVLFLAGSFTVVAVKWRDRSDTTTCRAFADTNGVLLQRQGRSSTNLVRGCNALNRANAKWDMDFASNALAEIREFHSETNARPRGLAERQKRNEDKYADAIRRHEKWSRHIAKYGHIHQWQKSTEDEDSEQSAAPLPSDPQTGHPEGER